MERVFDYIKQRAEKAGKSVPELCKEVGIPHYKVYQWNRADPKPVQVFRQLIDYLDKLEKK